MDADEFINEIMRILHGDELEDDPNEIVPLSTLTGLDMFLIGNALHVLKHLSPHIEQYINRTLRNLYEGSKNEDDSFKVPHSLIVEMETVWADCSALETLLHHSVPTENVIQR